MLVFCKFIQIYKTMNKNPQNTNNILENMKKYAKYVLTNEY